jgi:O-antigen/teichoic acid export membrane protein
MLDLGTGAALITMVGGATAVNRQTDARRHVTGALLVESGMAVLTLIAASLVVLTAVPRDQTGPYLIAVAGLAINVPLNGANCIWMALQKGYVSAFWELIQTLTILAGSIVATLVTVDVRIYVAVVYGGVALANLGSLVHLFLRHPELRPDAWAAPFEAARGVASQGAIYFAAGVAGGLTYMLDNVLALQLLGPEASARMAIALRICIGASGMLTIVSQPLWPAFAEAGVRGDLKWIERGLVRGTALVTGLAMAAAVFLVTAGGPFLRWWLHADLGIGPDLLWATAAWILAQAAGRVPYLLLNAVGVVRFQVVLCTLATSVALCLKFVWAPWLGVAGILWATAAAAAFISLPALTWRDVRWLKSCGSRPGNSR